MFLHKTVARIALSFFMVLGAVVFAYPQDASAQISAYAADEVIIKFKQSINASEEISIQSALGATTLKTFRLSGAQVWQISTLNATDAIAQYSNNANIEYIEPNFTLSVPDPQESDPLSLTGGSRPRAANATPNDPSFANLWGLHNTGQTGGTNDADIDAPEAWDIATGGNVIVGVIDTGVDYTHPDLAANMWVNTGETAGNGVDDDGNGYVDDVYGYDFANNDGDPMDGHYHGTHVAGTIAATGNNNTGVVGVSWSAKIMAIKFLSDSGSGSLADAIEAIEYATLMGAQLTNNSWGCSPGSCYSTALYDTIEAAGDDGQLFVAAAGNDNNDNDTTPTYPGTYDLDNVISVVATDHNDNKASFSSYGATTTDLGAPGVSIYSTKPGLS